MEKKRKEKKYQAVAVDALPVWRKLHETSNDLLIPLFLSSITHFSTTNNKNNNSNKIENPRFNKKNLNLFHLILRKPSTQNPTLGFQNDDLGKTQTLQLPASVSTQPKQSVTIRNLWRGFQA